MNESLTNLAHCPTLATLKSAALALDSPISYRDTLAQFRRIESALSQVKLERAAAEKQSQPISSLPPEILSHIFRIHRDLHDSLWADVTPPSIRVSHVSALWRETALCEPSLWKKITASPVYSLDFYNTMIYRSKKSQLAIAIKYKGPEDSISANRLAELIRSQVPLLRTLHIQAPLHFLHRHLHALHSLSAPSMTDLMLINTSREDRETILEAETLLIDRMFTGGTGKLFIFETKNVPLQIHPSFTSAKTLRLFYAGPITCSALHATLLESSQTLTILVISFRLSDAVLPLMSITMSCLAKLDIHGTSQVVFRLLGMIQAPLLEEMILTFIKTSLPLWADGSDGSIAGRFPKLRLLTLYGALERGILVHFPTTTELRISDHYPTITSLRDTFDPTHDGSSTQMPCLKTILVQEKFEEPIQNFFADRRLLGLIVPEVRVINML